jgi:hypothetical protein
MKVNAEQASKRVMYRPTGQSMLGRLKPAMSRSWLKVEWVVEALRAYRMWVLNSTS